ncbi:hypothetical protein Tco_1039300 [Tanacetum coccineum]
MLPMIISIRIPHMLHLEGKLFESLGCLVLVRRDCIGSSKFTIYEMRKGCYGWSSKYIVNTDDFMNPLLKGWSIRSIVWSIVLGEREEDSFLIINLSAKVVQYNLISKTLREIYDMGSNEIADDYLHGFVIIKSVIPNNPPAGLFVNHITSSFHCVFVSLDTRIKSTKYTSDKSFTLGYTEAVVNVNILQSCNDYAHDDSNFYGCAGLRLAFDPTKSPDYKVNDALHWLETENRRLTHYKLNIEDHEHPIITTIQISQDHEQPIITTMLPMIISIRIPHMLHLEGKLFESLGCLVLVRRDCIGSSKFTIYQMRKGCSVWSSKYIVNTDDFMNPLPEGWSIRSIVWSIVLGEREEDSFLIINLSAKVVQYNLISKTLREIYDMGSNEIADDCLHGFIPPYAMYDVGYKKLDYKVFEFIPSSASV